MEVYRDRMESMLAGVYNRANTQPMIPEGERGEYDRGQKEGFTVQNNGSYDPTKEKIDALLAAIERTRAGTFGICTTCGKPIPAKRLDACPYAPGCIDCRRKEGQRIKTYQFANP